MAKAKKKVTRKRVRSEEIGQLTEAEYFDLRLYAETHRAEASDFRYMQEAYRAHGLEITVATLKQKLCEKGLPGQKEALDNAQKEYNAVKSAIEKRIGQSLSEVDINPQTLKITKSRS